MTSAVPVEEYLLMFPGETNINNVIDSRQGQ